MALAKVAKQPHQDRGGGSWLLISESMQLTHDPNNLARILKRLSSALGQRGVALRLDHDSFEDDGTPMLKVQAWLSGRPSEAELVEILETGRDIVREVGTDAIFWTELSESNIVDFCFAAPSGMFSKRAATMAVKRGSVAAPAKLLFGGLSAPTSAEDRPPDPDSG